jgi:hypothetical protein
MESWDGGGDEWKCHIPLVFPGNLPSINNFVFLDFTSEKPKLRTMVM